MEYLLKISNYDDQALNTDWNWQPTKYQFPYSYDELFPHSGPEKLE